MRELHCCLCLFSGQTRRGSEEEQGAEGGGMSVEERRKERAKERWTVHWESRKSKVRDCERKKKRKTKTEKKKATNEV